MIVPTIGTKLAVARTIRTSTGPIWTNRRLHGSLDSMVAHSIPEPNSGCWLWLGTANAKGYGVVRRGGRGGGRPVFAHRHIYELVNGAIPDGLFICHRCDVPLCINPDHLFLGTQAENMRDCANKGRIRLPGVRGEMHPMAKLTEAEVREIRNDKRPSRLVGNDYGVSHATICYIRNGQSWK